MKKNCRTEYLYPNREDAKELQYEYFKNYYDCGLLENEMQEIEPIFITEKYYSGAKIKDITWEKNRIEKGSKIVANLPACLPEYIARTARIIMNEFLGVNSFSYHADIANERGYYLIAKQHLAVFLSVIENLLKNGINLMELPVNYSQFYFMESAHRYHGLIDTEYVHQAIRDTVNSSDCMNRMNKISLLKQYGQYTDLVEWLESIKQIMERVEEKALIPDPSTLDFSKNSYFMEEISKQRNEVIKFNGTVDEKTLTEAHPYIDKVIKNLKQTAKETETKLAIQYIKEILEKLAKNKDQKQETDLVKELREILESIQLTSDNKEVETVLNKEDLEKMLEEIKNYFEKEEKEDLQKEIENLKNEIIEKLLQEIMKSPRKKEDKEKIKQLKKVIKGLKLSEENKKLMKRIFNQELGEELEKALNDTTIEDLQKEVAELKEENRQLKEELEEKTKEIENLKTEIYDYLENGGKKPEIKTYQLTKDEINEILNAYEARKTSSKIRKLLFTGVLATSLLTNIVLLRESFVKKGQEISISTEMDNDNQKEITEEQKEFTSATPNKKNEKEENKSINKEIYLGKKVSLQNTDYYRSTRDLESAGTITEKVEGQIVGYFPYHYVDGKIEWLASLRSKEELQNFLEQNQDNLGEIYWKAAFAKGNEEEINELIDADSDISYLYTSFFIDFEPDTTKVKRK